MALTTDERFTNAVMSSVITVMSSVGLLDYLSKKSYAAGWRDGNDRPPAHPRKTEWSLLITLC